MSTGSIGTGRSTGAERGPSWRDAGATAAPRPERREEPVPPQQQVRPVTQRRTRRARLVLARLDPWSVLKLSFLLAVALAIVLLIAVGVLWYVLDSLGVFTSLSSTISEVTASESGGGFDLMEYVGFERVMAVTGVLVAVNAILLTALATLAAFLYNISSSLVGGLQVTLSEDA